MPLRKEDAIMRGMPEKEEKGRQEVEEQEIQNVRDKGEQIGIRILEMARDELYLEMRFLDASLNVLAYRKNLSTRLAGTDGEFIYFHPGFLMQRYQENPVWVNRLYLHMVLHCIFRHLWMREERNESDWNLACDIAVEAMIDSLTSDAFIRLIPEERERCYAWLSGKRKVLTAEGIYHILWNTPMEEEKRIRLEQEFLVDDHSFWEAEKQDKKTQQENSKKPGDGAAGQKGEKGTSEEKHGRGRASENQRWQQIAETMKTNLETFAKSAGDQAGTVLSCLSVAYRERRGYKDFLKRFAVWREELRADEDSYDLNFYTFGLSNYGNLPLVEPLEYREEKKIEEFVIVLDTSGSCPEAAVQRFLSETYSILKTRETFFQKMKIHLLQCDIKVQSDQIITSEEELNALMQQIRIQGNGGTDFRPAFRYVEQLREAGELKRLKGLLYFTDGYGIFPEKRPPFETAFLFYREDGTDVAAPPWAIKLILDEEALEGRRTVPERFGGNEH